jgi:putative hydrolase of the HAD superfamily
VAQGGPEATRKADREPADPGLMTMFEPVRVITFDLDDTLWPCRDVIQAAEQASYDWLAAHAPVVTERYTPDALREHRLAVGRERPDLAHDLTAVRLLALTAVVTDAGYPASVAVTANAIFREVRNRVTPFDDVAQGLTQLRGRYTLISVTNGNSQIDRTPLRDAFHHSLTAAEVGAAKPDPAIFHAASRHSGEPLSRFLHVGDDPLRDVQAARDLGMPTVWVNRYDRPWPDDIAPADLEVRDIATLVRVLSPGA